MVHHKVSILIPVYGVEKYIEKCARSLFDQNYDNIEFIFVNDCTKDNSINVLNEVISFYPEVIQAKVKIIHHSRNKGIAGTRNTLLKNATGMYVYFVDSDDYIDINAIDNLVKTIENENVDIVFDSYFVINGQDQYRRVHKMVSKEKHLEEMLFRRTYFNLWGNLYKKSLFDDLNFVEGFNFGEDFSILPKLVYKSNAITFTNYAFYNYRLLNDNSYTKNIKKKSLEDIIVAYESIKLFFELNAPKYNELINKSFYTLKAQMIKTTKGDKELLNEFKLKLKNYPKKYPKTNSIINNCINLMFDFNITLCSLIIRKLSR